MKDHRWAAVVIIRRMVGCHVVGTVRGENIADRWRCSIIGEMDIVLDTILMLGIITCHSHCHGPSCGCLGPVCTSVPFRLLHFGRIVVGFIVPRSL